MTLLRPRSPAAGVEPAALCLEITETALTARAGRVHPRLEALKALGVRLAIDDFGTGLVVAGRAARCRSTR